MPSLNQKHKAFAGLLLDISTCDCYTWNSIVLKEIRILRNLQKVFSEMSGSIRVLQIFLPSITIQLSKFNNQHSSINHHSTLNTLPSIIIQHSTLNPDFGVNHCHLLIFLVDPQKHRVGFVSPHVTPVPET